MQKDPVQEISKRTQRYWFEDGIWEIGFGLVNAFLGVFYLVTAQIHWEGPLSIFLMLLQMGVLISCFALINRVVVYLKSVSPTRAPGMWPIENRLYGRASGKFLSPCSYRLALLLWWGLSVRCR